MNPKAANAWYAELFWLTLMLTVYHAIIKVRKWQAARRARKNEALAAALLTARWKAQRMEAAIERVKRKKAEAGDAEGE